MRFKQCIFGLALAVSVIAVMAPGAQAVRLQPRPDWMVSVGFGMGRGSLTEIGGGISEYRNGAVPVMRIGRMLGSRAMVGVNYGGWVFEFGDVPLKNRRSLQNFDLAIAVFPGSPDGVSGGIYLRGGGGIGWVSNTEIEITPDEPQGHGEGFQEWGIGVFAEAGYEFWISRSFTAGVGVNYNYLKIEESVFDSAWFSSVIMNLNLYF